MGKLEKHTNKWKNLIWKKAYYALRILNVTVYKNMYFCAIKTLLKTKKPLDTNL